MQLCIIVVLAHLFIATSFYLDKWKLEFTWKRVRVGTGNFSLKYRGMDELESRLTKNSVQGKKVSREGFYR